MQFFLFRLFDWCEDNNDDKLDGKWQRSRREVLVEWIQVDSWDDYTHNTNTTKKYKSKSNFPYPASQVRMSEKRHCAVFFFAHTQSNGLWDDDKDSDGTTELNEQGK